MTLAVSLPEMPGNLMAALVAAGALAILIAARRTDNTWERLFARGICAFAAWAGYYFAVQSFRPFASFHVYVFFALMTASLGLTIAGWTRAQDGRQRMASAGVGLFIVRAWWESVLSVSCGDLGRYQCRSGFASNHIPDWLMFVMFLTAVALFVQAWRIASTTPPSRWIVLGFALYVLFDAYIALRTLGSGVLTQDTLAKIIEFVGYGGAVAAWVMAARTRERQTTMIFGAGLVLFAVPNAWSALRVLVM